MNKFEIIEKEGYRLILVNYRYSSTFGCEPRLVADLTRAYADGFQSPDGNVYDFAFGLNWNGAIADRRTERYR